MHSIDNEDTFDLLAEIEKWYEESYTKEDWVSAFTRKNMGETLHELDDFIWIESPNTSLQDASITSESTSNTKSNRCLMNDFEIISSSFDLDAPLLCSTPLSRKDQDMEELRIDNQSDEDYSILPNIVHQEKMTLLDTYPSYLSNSLESLSLTHPIDENNVPELEYTSCSSLDIIDFPSSSVTYIQDPLQRSKECPITDSLWKYTNMSNPLLKNKYPLHIALSISDFEMFI